MKFRVYGVVTGSKYLGKYEADSKEAAIAMALDDCCVSLCHQCSRECEDPEIIKAVAEECGWKE
jgi:hypothetical protein